MRKIDENIVLNFYLDEIGRGSIEFLKNRESYKNQIREFIVELRDCEEMHDKIEIAKKLWKVLFEAAMSHIDTDKRGYNDLFNFFDEYVEFEELIFASDSFYRDHTVHCLWVYFLGEYLSKKEEFEFLTARYFDDYKLAYTLIELLEKTSLSSHVPETMDFLYKMDKLIKNQDSIRCISAITHDLGYPLKKINKINKSISRVLPYFSINNYNEFDFQYNDIKNNFIKGFLDFISDSIHAAAGFETKDDSENEELMKKIFVIDENTPNGKLPQIKDNIELSDDELKKLTNLHNFEMYIANNKTNYLRYSNDFENYEHGIMSAFLLMKQVKCFKNTKYSYRDSKNLNFGDVDLSEITAKQLILRAISDHTSDGYQITNIYDPSSMLAFTDELEEFSRISRASQNRQYVNEFCKTEIDMEEGILKIDFIFDNENIQSLDPERAFKGRCKRFLTLFDIKNLDENLKIDLRCIGKLSKNNNVYKLEIRKGYANILINDKEQNIPNYLGDRQFYTTEEYMSLNK